jgi:hypothetical protein
MLTPLIAFGIFVTVVLLFEGGYYFVHSGRAALMSSV